MSPLFVSTLRRAGVIGTGFLFACNTGGTTPLGETSSVPTAAAGGSSDTSAPASGGAAGAAASSASGGAGAGGKGSGTKGAISGCVTGPVATMDTVPHPVAEACPAGVAWHHTVNASSIGVAAFGATAWLAAAYETTGPEPVQVECPTSSPALPHGAFLAAYDVSSGAVQWVHALGPDARPLAVERLSNGAIAVFGRGGCYLPPKAKLGSPIDRTRFVTAISADGTEVLWSRGYAEATTFNADQIAPTPDGGLLVAGTTVDEVVGDISAAPGNVGSDEHAFLAKLSAAGDVVWTVLVYATHPSYLVLHGMSVGSNGVVHLMGQWNGPDEVLAVSDLTISGKGTFYAQLDGATGHGLMIRKLSKIEEAASGSIAAATGGGVYVSGPIDASSCPPVGPNQKPLPLIRLDASGACLWRGAWPAGSPLSGGTLALVAGGESPAPLFVLPQGVAGLLDPQTGLAHPYDLPKGAQEALLASRIVVRIAGGLAGAE